MQFNEGDVMRLEYKWPHQRKKEDGNKSRPAVVFKNLDGKFFVSPFSTVPPSAANAPYAIPVSTRLQQQLGIESGKPGWVYANHANLVEPPNPAIVKARQDSWTHGTVPSGLLKNLQEKRDAAIAAKQMHLAPIKKDATLDRYRSASASKRLTPGQQGNNDARASDIKAKAEERAKRAPLTLKRARADATR